MELTLFYTVFLFQGILLIHTTEATKFCVSCSSMDNIVAQEATKNILQTYNYQSCRTYDTASNKSGIKMELCETTSSSIYETKTCGILEGFVNGTGLNYPMSMNIFYRGCLSVRSLVYGCQNTDSNPMDMGQNLGKVFQPLSNYAIKSFKGKRCLCKSNLCEISSSWKLSMNPRLWIATAFLIFSILN